MNQKDITLSKYKQMFCQLNVNKYHGHLAPHKPVLLLAIMSLVEDELIVDNRIRLDDELTARFQSLWKQWVKSGSLFTPDITKPYFHMQNEPFWRLVTHAESAILETMVAEDAPTFYEQKAMPGYTIKKMQNAFAYAELDYELFELLKDHDAAIELRGILISYFTRPQKDFSSMELISALAPVIAAVVA